MSAQITTTTADKARGIVTAAAVDSLLALPRDARQGIRPLPALLPEIVEARAHLERTRPELMLRNARMADGSGFAEVLHTVTYGVLLSSERYPDGDDLAQRYAAMVAVSRAVLEGALDR